MIRGCDYVSLPVEDFDGAIRFYRDAVGLRLLFRIEERWAEFQVGDVRPAVYPREEGEGRGGEVAFLVEDLSREMSRLRSHGVAFPHGPEEFHLPTGSGRLARFGDPSGNRLELVERK